MGQRRKEAICVNASARQCFVYQKGVERGMHLQVAGAFAELHITHLFLPHLVVGRLQATLKRLFLPGVIAQIRAMIWKTG